MEHSVKIVIGANYGDEGKGLMSRYFTKQFVDDGKKPVTVFHNGSAQRGHTVDYEDGSRHVFHNFCAGTKEGGITFYDRTFMVHPMDFCRELKELNFLPPVYCDPQCIVVTPADMLTDHVIEDYIAVKSGAREYGSCGYGTWSTTDRIKERPDLAYTIIDMARGNYWKIADSMREWADSRIKTFNIELEAVPQWKRFFDRKDRAWELLWSRFQYDVYNFAQFVKFASFDSLWVHNDAIIFEGAQGLLLDKDRDDIWTTTSNTGIKNPYRLLHGRKDFRAEVCYVSRSYVTRHGDGPLPDEVEQQKIGDSLFDHTNVFNNFQGNLRYALISKPSVAAAIYQDFQVAEDGPFDLSIAYTHCNEHDIDGGTYRSCSKTEVKKV